MAAPYGTSNSHNYGRYYIGRGFRAARNSLDGGKNKKGNRNDIRNRKAEFENQAKLMQYGATLKDWNSTQDSARQDWHQSRLPEHLDATMERMQKHLDPDVARTSAMYQFGNAKVSLSGSLRKPVREGKSEDHPHGQGQQMKQFAGPRKTFLGVYKEEGDAPDKEYPLANIPTLTSENSTTDENGHIKSVGWVKRNPKTNSFESNVGPKDNYENQQDIQDQQADEFHNRGQQMTMFDQHGNSQV